MACRGLAIRSANSPALQQGTWCAARLNTNARCTCRATRACHLPVTKAASTVALCALHCSAAQPCPCTAPTPACVPKPGGRTPRTGHSLPSQPHPTPCRSTSPHWASTPTHPPTPTRPHSHAAPRRVGRTHTHPPSTALHAAPPARTCIQLEEPLQRVHRALHQRLKEVAQLVAEDGKPVLKLQLALREGVLQEKMGGWGWGWGRGWGVARGKLQLAHGEGVPQGRGRVEQGRQGGARLGRGAGAGQGGWGCGGVHSGPSYGQLGAEGRAIACLCAPTLAALCSLQHLMQSPCSCLPSPQFAPCARTHPYFRKFEDRVGRLRRTPLERRPEPPQGVALLANLACQLYACTWHIGGDGWGQDALGGPPAPIHARWLCTALLAAPPSLLNKLETPLQGSELTQAYHNHPAEYEHGQKRLYEGRHAARHCRRSPAPVIVPGQHGVARAGSLSSAGCRGTRDFRQPYSGADQLFQATRGGLHKQHTASSGAGPRDRVSTGGRAFGSLFCFDGGNGISTILYSRLLRAGGDRVQ